MTTAVVQMWGNTRAVRIPKPLAEQTGLEEGVAVELVPSKAGLLLRPTRARRQYRLSKLLAGCRGRNPHREAWRQSAGNESL